MGGLLRDFFRFVDLFARLEHLYNPVISIELATRSLEPSYFGRLIVIRARHGLNMEIWNEREGDGIGGNHGTAQGKSAKVSEFSRHEGKLP